jgi:hypothetical protein
MIFSCLNVNLKNILCCFCVQQKIKQKTNNVMQNSNKGEQESYIFSRCSLLSFVTCQWPSSPRGMSNIYCMTLVSCSLLFVIGIWFSVNMILAFCVFFGGKGYPHGVALEFHFSCFVCSWTWIFAIWRWIFLKHEKRFHVSNFVSFNSVRC